MMCDEMKMGSDSPVIDHLIMKEFVIDSLGIYRSKFQLS